ncbi:MAG: radical SAM protein [Candidatus Riflebacteria bacterium]|nr:radical SAM protein [Candidatus Riflebacteria bacterium]
MNLTALDLIPKLAGFKLSHLLGTVPPTPINLTFSVTNLCQSRCLTCGIWRFYQDDPKRLEDELSLDEIAQVFRSIGHVYFFNVSGGEPFLRNDFEEIVRLALRHLTPAVVHCPTNVLGPSRVLSGTRKILEIIARERPGTPFTIKPSFDGVGDEHDRIRGVPGNFQRLLTAVDGLKRLKREFPDLHVGLGTVISQHNLASLVSIQQRAMALEVDTYISEVAEERAEMANAAGGMTPSPDEYERAIRPFKERILATLPGLRGLARVTQTLRTLYYDLTVRILRERRQVLACHAGISNAHLSAYGDVWPCAVLGQGRSMGNVRDHGLDFRAVWRSRQARDVRAFIKGRTCACPLANQAYANLLLDPVSLMRAALALLSPGRVTGPGTGRPR